MYLGPAAEMDVGTLSVDLLPVKTHKVLFQAHCCFNVKDLLKRVRQTGGRRDSGGAVTHKRSSHQDEFSTVYALS